MSDFRVLIVGAGITGLVLAQGLKKRGIPFAIYEKEKELNYRSNEWTMAIHWSLDRLESVLPPELFARLAEISCNPSIPIEAGGKYPIIHGETGNLLAGVPYSKGLRVPRSKMRALCAEGIEVEYGKEIVDVAFNESGKGVIATFRDGSIAQGSVLLGADGPRSKVRQLIFNDNEGTRSSVSRFHIFHTNMTVSYGDADKARYLRQVFPTSYLALSDRSFHAFQSISSMPDGPDHPETWVFHLAMAWLGQVDNNLSYPERLALIKKKAQGLGEPARSAFMWIPEDTLVHKADISYWIPEAWNNRNGRISLVGDAAHPMPPYRGQGLNHCICDVSNLLQGLDQFQRGQCGLEQVIADYETEMIPRGIEEVKCSLQNADMLHDWDKVRQSPVFGIGFKPMDGHDQGREGEYISEHARIQRQRDGVLKSDKVF